MSTEHTSLTLLSADNRYRDMLEPDHWSDTDSVESVDNEYSSSSGGPYDAVLQDFMIRSYMPGKRNKTTIVSTGMCACVCTCVMLCCGC